MQVKDIVASQGLDFSGVEVEFDDLFENAAMVSAAMRNCTTCEHKEALSFLRQTFTGTPEEFVALANEAFKGCCTLDCAIYKIAVKFEGESGIKACKSCPKFLENLERQGKVKCQLCKEALVRYYQ